MIKDVLIAVEAALQSIPEIKYINEDWGQIDYYAQPPVLWPCVLLECEGVDYQTLTKRAQLVHGDLTVRIADYRNLQQANAMSTSTAPRYEYFDLIAKVNIALQGLSGATFSALDRRTLRRVRRDDAVREFVLTYKFSFNDTSAVQSRVHANPLPNIEILLK